MSAEGLELYALGEASLASDQPAEAVVYLRAACSHLSTHAAAHHLFGKALALVCCYPEAEAMQLRSCGLDPALGWNWFALAELQQRRVAWYEAAEAYAKAAAALPDQGWIREKARSCHQMALLGGVDLRAGLTTAAYQLWCEQLEPRLPSALEPLEQRWCVLEAGRSAPADSLPADGWLVLVGPGVTLRPRALQAMDHWLRTGSVWGHSDPHLKRLQQVLPISLQSASPDLISCDEDRIDQAGGRQDPWFKPGQLAESSWSTPWLSSLSVWRCSWLRLHGLGWPPDEPKERERWLWQALLKRPKHSHLPLVLAHVPVDVVSPVSPAYKAQCVYEHLRQAGESITAVHPHPDGGDGFLLEWAIPKELRCSVIVPTRDRADLLDQCIKSVSETTMSSGVDLNWIVIDNGSVELKTSRCLLQWQQRFGAKFQVISDGRAFNWSSLNNLAASASTADLLLFLNNDVQAIQSGWLERMVAQAVRPSVGCAGALLLYPDGGLQHAGVVVGMHGGADHAYRGLSPEHGVHRGRSRYLSDWGAVTGACLMVERALFAKVGGFDPALPVEFNDVDFCLRLEQLGYRHVVDPSVRLVHHESQSRDAAGSATAAAALELMQSRWQARMQHASPWWPSACTSDWHDGRPSGLECVRPNGSGIQAASEQIPAEAHRGHVDHLWMVAPECYLVSGWCSDLSPEARLEWQDPGGSWHAILLGPARIGRPDVAEELGISGIRNPDFGFLVAVQCIGRESCSIRFGESEITVSPHALFDGNAAESLERLIDACNWGNTPPEKCATLLSAALGQSLLWLRDHLRSRSEDAPVEAFLGPLALIVELNDDVQLTRCRLWQLQRLKALFPEVHPVLLAPATCSLWALEGCAPAWLERLSRSTGLNLPITFSGDSLLSDWVLCVEPQAPLLFLEEGLELIWPLCLKLLMKNDDQIDRYLFNAFPGVTLTRAAAVGRPEALISDRHLDDPEAIGDDQLLTSPRVTANRSSWLRAIDRWLFAVHRAGGLM